MVKAVEQTLAMIKPDAVQAGNAEKIMKDIEAAGFTIVAKRKYTMTKQQAEQFYQEHNGRPFFHDLTTFMSSGPIWALILEKANAIKAWRELMGPTNSHKARAEAPSSMRAKYGTDGQKNATHGSDSPSAATAEQAFHFGPKASRRTPGPLLRILTCCSPVSAIEHVSIAVADAPRV